MFRYIFTSQNRIVLCWEGIGETERIIEAPGLPPAALPLVLGTCQACSSGNLDMRSLVSQALVSVSTCLPLCMYATLLFFLWIFFWHQEIPVTKKIIMLLISSTANTCMCSVYSLQCHKPHVHACLDAPLLSIFLVIPRVACLYFSEIHKVPGPSLYYQWMDIKVWGWRINFAHWMKEVSSNQLYILLVWVVLVCGSCACVLMIQETKARRWGMNDRTTNDLVLLKEIIRLTWQSVSLRYLLQPI